MPRAIAALATRPPIAPRPTTARVRPGSSVPANAFFPASTALWISASVPPCPASLRTNSTAGTTRRLATIRPAITSSLTALALAPGALKTGIPRSVMVTTGMLFTPAPARPIAFSEGPNVALCRSADRRRIASGSGISAPVMNRSCGSLASPAAEMLLSVCTLNMGSRVVRISGSRLVAGPLALGRPHDQHADHNDGGRHQHRGAKWLAEQQRAQRHRDHWIDVRVERDGGDWQVAQGV